MALEQTIKSSSPLILSVALTGGGYTFTAGSIVTETETLCRPFAVGNEYLVLLIRSDNNTYHPPSTCQSTFEIAPDGLHVKSHTYLADDHLRDSAKLGKRALIRKIQALVAAEWQAARASIILEQRVCGVCRNVALISESSRCRRRNWTPAAQLGERRPGQAGLGCRERAAWLAPGIGKDEGDRSGVLFNLIGF